jgi:hypothetical protein
MPNLSQETQNILKEIQRDVAHLRDDIDDAGTQLQAIHNSLVAMRAERNLRYRQP